MKNLIFLSSLYCCGTFLSQATSLAQWIQTNGPQSESAPSAGLITALVVCPNNNDSTVILAGTSANGIFRSTNRGATWSAVNSGLSDTSIWALAVDGSTIYTGTLSGVFRSSNNGTKWTQNMYYPTLSIAVGPTSGHIFAGTRNGVVISIDGGKTWSRAQPTALTDNVKSISTGTDETGNIILFAGTEMNGVWRSNEQGTNWSPINTGLNDTEIPALGAKAKQGGGTDIFAGTYRGGVFLLNENGTSWSASGLANIHVFTFLVNDTSLIAGTLYGAFHSANNGMSWTELNSGLTNTWISALAMSHTSIFAGTSGNGVWRRPLSEFVTSIQEPKVFLPSTFSLFQNYPNPFNPTTNISYSVPVNSSVRINIYDVLGREIRTLINERETAGTHSVTFNASNLPSGIYFYTLTAGSYINTKKLMVIK